MNLVRIFPKPKLIGRFHFTIRQSNRVLEVWKTQLTIYRRYVALNDNLSNDMVHMINEKIPTFCNKFHCCESDVRFAGKSHFLTRIRFFSSVKQYSSMPGELPSLHRISPFFVLVKTCSRLSLVRHLVKVKFISNNVSLFNVTR